MPAELEYNATLRSRADISEGLSIFHVEPDAPLPSDWTPGQYLTLGLNKAEHTGFSDDAPVSVRRPMSIASAPADTARFEFYIRYVSRPESSLPFTHLLWKHEVGQRMHMRPVPTGHFTLPHTIGDGHAEDSRLKVMVAAGTGLAPFVSIARARLTENPDASLADLAIIHGASYPEDLGYREELEGYARDRGLRYIPTVSRAASRPEWKGRAGRAEAMFSAEQLAQTEDELGVGAGGLRPDTAVVLVCGLVGTIAGCIESLLPRGFVPNNRKIRRALEVDDDQSSGLFYEQYDTTPVIDVKDEAVVARVRDLFRSGSTSP